MTSMRLFKVILIILSPILVSYIFQPSVHRWLTVFGVFRQPAQTSLQNSQDLVVIEDTRHCEDLHYYAPGHTIFTACEDSLATRFSWFPPLGIYNDPAVGLAARGSIHVVDPETMKSHRLTLDGFSGPFITHGIDVITAPNSGHRDAVYIFAVNHVPNKQFFEMQKKPTGYRKTDSNYHNSDPRVEIFYHVLGSSSAQHIRSIKHPLVKTPNDIVADGPTSYFVTNDHYYSHGFMRLVEDVYFGAKWSNIIRVQFSEAPPTQTDSGAGINATIALSGLHNNNGLGHGNSAGEVLIVSAASGVLYITRLPQGLEKEIEVLDAIQFDSIIDNPTYFSDPFANASYDASGYVVAGLTRAVDLPKTSRDPLAKEGVMIWYARKKSQDDIINGHTTEFWDKHLIFEDDGHRIRSASAAVLVAIDPMVEEGERKAWLFVSGFLSENMIAVKVNLN